MSVVEGVCRVCLYGAAGTVPFFLSHVELSLKDRVYLGGFQGRRKGMRASTFPERRV